MPKSLAEGLAADVAGFRDDFLYRVAKSLVDESQRLWAESAIFSGNLFKLLFHLQELKHSLSGFRSGIG